MSRSLTTALNNELISSEMNPFMAVSLDFEDGTFYSWTGYGDITFGGETYFGSGDIIHLGSVNETSEIRANGIQISLSGIPAELVSAALQDPYQGRIAKIYFGVLNGTTGAVIADPYLIFKGRMDLMTIEDGGETASISVTAESRLIDLNRAKERRFTDNDQKIDYPDDKGLQHIQGLQEKQISWGG
tara:strand:- start:247 stop:807 length:561 start_codon:yes stop_codon:yes gene_type:complete